MHRGETADITIISYKPLSGLNFARNTEQHGSYMPSTPLGSIDSISIPASLNTAAFSMSHEYSQVLHSISLASTCTLLL